MRAASVYSRMTAQPGQREALIKQFRDVLRLGIPGLEWCSINTVLDDPDTIWVTQIWTDKPAPRHRNPVILWSGRHRSRDVAGGRTARRFVAARTFDGRMGSRGVEGPDGDGVGAVGCADDRPCAYGESEVAGAGVGAGLLAEAAAAVRSVTSHQVDWILR